MDAPNGQAVKASVGPRKQRYRREGGVKDVDKIPWAGCVTGPAGVGRGERRSAFEEM